MKLAHHLIVVSAPSGAGKTTICNQLLNRNENFRVSVSATTRPPRPNEKDGIDYIFVSDEMFWKKVDNGEFLEYEPVHGYYYGTLKSKVNELINQGYYVIFDIDVNGALSLKKRYPEAILIFLKPPSIEELKRRLIERKSDDPVEIEKRLNRLPEEYEKSKQFDHIVVNDDLNRTVIEIEEIINNAQKVTSDASQQNI